MERNYATGTKNNVIYFVGIEVEHTPAHGLKTLFVVGPQDPMEVLNEAQDANVKHVYLGANKSFDHSPTWKDLVDKLIHEGYWVTLDYPQRMHNSVMRQLNQQMRNSRFIPMISVEIPNIEVYNYNTMLKIDDISMDHSNPGVWCHSLYDLMDRSKFTGWDEYKDDEIIDK